MLKHPYPVCHFTQATLHAGLPIACYTKAATFPPSALAPLSIICSCHTLLGCCVGGGADSLPNLVAQHSRHQPAALAPSQHRAHTAGQSQGSNQPRPCDCSLQGIRRLDKGNADVNTLQDFSLLVYPFDVGEPHSLAAASHGAASHGRQKCVS